MTTLNKKAIEGLLQFVSVLALLIFLPAWTISYWQAWIFLAVFTTSVLAITVYLMRYDPKLLERRVNAGPGAEKERKQKIIQSIASLAFIAIIVLPGLDHHFGWSIVPTSVAIVGDGLVALGLLCIYFVFKANSFTSATIETATEQKVISTGPYALIRHPMYSGAFVMLVGIPLALGSWWGLLAVVPMVIVITWRLLDEEAFLGKNLPGYEEYRKKVKYRLLPLIW